MSFPSPLWRALALILPLALTGCGSDNDGSASTPEVPQPPESSSPILRPHKNIELVGVPKHTELDGKIGVQIGSEQPWLLDLSRITLPTTRPDIFAEGQHSAFDVLRYLADEGMIDLDWDGGITAQDTVNFTVNGQPDWWFKFNHNSYTIESMLEQYQAGALEVEYTYDRIDQFLVKNGTILQFLHTPDFSRELTKVRDSEMSRTDFAETGKVVVPKVYIHLKMRALPEGGGTPYLGQPDYTFDNVEVQPFDLRPDLWQPGTVTMADVFATIAATPEYNNTFAPDERKLQMVYWPTLRIGPDRDHWAEVESYAVTQIAGKHEDTLAAWSLFAGESMSRSDFFNGGGSKCGSGPGQSPEFCAFFGGHLIHVMPDNRVLRHATEEIHLFWYDLWVTLDPEQGETRSKKKWPAKPEHYQFYMDPTNPIPDGIKDLKDINNALAPLTNSHFGWGVADCSQCHSVEGIHAKNDAGERFERVRAYECAECHGSNGAPKGHEMNGRCFWCHQSVIGHRDMADNGDGLSHTADRFPDPYSCVTCHRNDWDGITDPAITLDMEFIQQP
ncbi:cytochrome c3 family protein [Ferrimonas kyonanensis]|uniref:cytochrome c3 family protein n=1 Tax=Ferrimonas kyonanensis TaxID=364763 RepID=UPI0003FCD830|nr:cytochrome c3 family protein [Ferrimonas kyonanensis]